MDKNQIAILALSKISKRFTTNDGEQVDALKKVEADPIGPPTMITGRCYDQPPSVG